MSPQSWSLSQPDGGIVHEREVAIPLADGISLHCAVTRPSAPGRHPVLLGVHAYSMDDQFTDLMPEGMSHRRGHMEAGDSAFFARRGYGRTLLNIGGGMIRFGIAHAFEHEDEPMIRAVRSCVPMPNPGRRTRWRGG